MSGPSDYDSLLRQLEELRQRAEQAEKQRHEERLARQEERLGREQAEKQRQEERLGREQAEKQRQEAEKQRQEERLGREQAEKQRQEERLGREQAEKQRQEERLAREQAEKQRQEAEKQRQEAEKRIQKSTFLEFLHHCHTYYTEPLGVQTDKEQSTGGTTVRPYGACYPFKLLHWDDFIDGQRSRFDIVSDVFHPKPQPDDASHSMPPPAIRALPSKIEVEGNGRYACSRLFASEDDLKIHQHYAVELPVTDIVAALSKTSHPSIQKFHIGSGVSFENHKNTLSKESQGADKRQRLSNSQHKKIRTGPSDQICVHHRADGKRTMAFIIEYKAPHKLTVEDFRWALSKANLCQEVIERYKKYENSKDQEKAEDIVGMVVSQTFNYMIEKRTEYGYLTTGEAFIFFWIKEEDPRTLYYHLVAPKEEVRAKSSIFYSAICQVACFCLMALTSERRSHAWQTGALTKLKTWPNRYEDIGQYITDDEDERQTLSPSPYEPPPSLTVSQPSHYSLRSRVTCREPEATGVRRDRNSDDSDNDDSSHTLHRLRPSNTSGPGRQSITFASGNGAEFSQTETEHQNRPYCTQACLLGLKKGGALDENCPNVSSHRTPGSAYHPINAEQFASLIQVQLGQDFDHDFEPLDGKQGARGALLKLTLARYGYTLVAKGTVSTFVWYLRHEGRIYCRLEKLQGRVVPVYLGNIDLTRSYCLDAGVWLVHLLLMSWGGEMVDLVTVPNLEGEIERSLKELHGEGVAHGDARHANMLWNTEQHRVMLVDFDCAFLPPPLKHKQLSQLGKKRKRQLELSETCHRKRVFISS